MIFVQNFFKRITKFSQDYLTLLAWLSNKAIIFYPSQLSLSLYALTFDSLDRCDLLIHFFSSKLPVSLCRMECLIHYSNYSEGKEISRWLLAAFSLWFIYGPGLSFFALLCDLSKCSHFCPSEDSEYLPISFSVSISYGKWSLIFLMAYACQ